MPRKPKSTKQPVTKLSTEEIFDAVRDPANETIEMYDGDLDGEKVTFMAAPRANGEVVPLALILDAKTSKLLSMLVEELHERDEEDEEDDEDEDEDDEDDSFDP